MHSQESRTFFLLKTRIFRVSKARKRWWSGHSSGIGLFFFLTLVGVGRSVRELLWSFGRSSEYQSDFCQSFFEHESLPFPPANLLLCYFSLKSTAHFFWGQDKRPWKTLKRCATPGNFPLQTGKGDAAKNSSPFYSSLLPINQVTVNAR